MRNFLNHSYKIDENGFLKKEFVGTEFANRIATAFTENGKNFLRFYYNTDRKSEKLVEVKNKSSLDLSLNSTIFLLQKLDFQSIKRDIENGIPLEEILKKNKTAHSKLYYIKNNLIKIGFNPCEYRNWVYGVLDINYRNLSKKDPGETIEVLLNYLLKVKLTQETIVPAFKIYKTHRLFTYKLFLSILDVAGFNLE